MGRFLSPIERHIWQLFQDKNLPDQNEIYFETPIQPLEPDAKYVQNRERAWWEKLTALKADVIWHTAEGWNLAEIEEELNMTGIGQALCYREHWNELNPETPIKKTWIITAGDDPRLHAGVRAAGLEHYLVNVL